MPHGAALPTPRRLALGQRVPKTHIQTVYERQFLNKVSLEKQQRENKKKAQEKLDAAKNFKTTPKRVRTPSKPLTLQPSTARSTRVTATRLIESATPTAESQKIDVVPAFEITKVDTEQDTNSAAPTPQLSARSISEAILGPSGPYVSIDTGDTTIVADLDAMSISDGSTHNDMEAPPSYDEITEDSIVITEADHNKKPSDKTDETKTHTKPNTPVIKEAQKPTRRKYDPLSMDYKPADDSFYKLNASKFDKSLRRY